MLYTLHPTLKRWAILLHPSGMTPRLSQNLDAADFRFVGGAAGEIDNYISLLVCFNRGEIFDEGLVLAGFSGDVEICENALPINLHVELAPSWAEFGFDKMQPDSKDAGFVRRNGVGWRQSNVRSDMFPAGRSSER